MSGNHTHVEIQAGKIHHSKSYLIITDLSSTYSQALPP